MISLRGDVANRNFAATDGSTQRYPRISVHRNCIQIHPACPMILEFS